MLDTGLDLLTAAINELDEAKRRASNAERAAEIEALIQTLVAVRHELMDLEKKGRL